MEFKHIPVMLNECLLGLKLVDGGTYVDATIGGAGHSQEILKRTKNSKLIGIDQDKTAIEVCKDRLMKFGDRVTLIHNNFSNLKNILDGLNLDEVDGILIDLGVSSYQIDTPERGFSFRFNAPLDMRMNQENPLSAFEVVNTYSEAKLKQLIFDYGEDRFASTIARRICFEREVAPIKTTGQLKEIIISAVPRHKGKDALDSVQRTFQALRIEVNGELDIIKQTLIDAIDHLKVGGRIAVLTFHSLEDRIVKTTFKELTVDCVCPPKFPVCVCGGNHATLKLVNTKPITASKEELKLNTRSACAKLRVAEKIKQN